MAATQPAAPVVITWLRHGSVAGPAHVLRGTSDDPLSHAGELELQAALARLNGRYSRIASSPRQRCAGFAARFASASSTELELIDELAEMHFGAWEGLSANEAAALDPVAYARFRADPLCVDPPGGESYSHFSARVARVVEQLATGPGPVLAFTHAGVIRAVVAQALELAPAAAGRIALAPAAWARISYLTGQPPILLELQSHC